MATSTIRTNENNDLYLPDGQNLQIISGVEACIQDIGAATKMRLGEDVYDTTSGVDYFGTIFTPQPNFDAARESIATAILSSPDTINIEQLDVVIESEVFKFVARINTIYGPIPVSV